jgi:hypothetical protein
MKAKQHILIALTALYLILAFSCYAKMPLEVFTIKASPKNMAKGDGPRLDPELTYDTPLKLIAIRFFPGNGFDARLLTPGPDGETPLDKLRQFTNHPNFFTGSKEQCETGGVSVMVKALTGTDWYGWNTEQRILNTGVYERIANVPQDQLQPFDIILTHGSGNHIEMVLPGWALQPPGTPIPLTGYSSVGLGLYSFGSDFKQYGLSDAYTNGHPTTIYRLRLPKNWQYGKQYRI